MSKTKIIFMGTPEFAVPSLAALYAADYDIAAVYTQPDRPAGRGRKLTASPVKQFALDKQLEVVQIENFKVEGAIAQVQAYQADFIIVVAYGLLLPQAVLDAAKQVCLNVHASLLPRWRGAAPIQRAIQAGDSETGISIMQMALGLDSGPVYSQQHLPITVNTTGASLHDDLAKKGAELLITTLADIKHDNLTAKSQDESLVTYAHKLNKAEAEVDWQQDAMSIARMVRAFNPWPVAFSHFKEQRVRIWQAEVLTEPPKAQTAVGDIVQFTPAGLDIMCGDQQILRITQLQFSGGKVLSAAEAYQAKASLLGG